MVEHLISEFIRVCRVGGHTIRMDKIKCMYVRFFEKKKTNFIPSSEKKILRLSCYDREKKLIFVNEVLLIKSFFSSEKIKSLKVCDLKITIY